MSPDGVQGGPRREKGSSTQPWQVLDLLQKRIAGPVSRDTGKDLFRKASHRAGSMPGVRCVFGVLNSSLKGNLVDGDMRSRGGDLSLVSLIPWVMGYRAGHNHLVPPQALG